MIQQLETWRWCEVIYDKSNIEYVLLVVSTSQEGNTTNNNRL